MEKKQSQELDVISNVQRALTENSVKGYSGLLNLPEEQRWAVANLVLTTRTPQRFIRERKGKGNKTFSYVPREYVERALNIAFGFKWNFRKVGDFEVSNTDISVAVELEVTLPDGSTIVKQQVGAHDIVNNVPLGHIKKAAMSDGLKKCASMLGIAADVYSTDELQDGKAAYSYLELVAKLGEYEKYVESSDMIEKITKLKEWLMKYTDYDDLVAKCETLEKINYAWLKDSKKTPAQKAAAKIVAKTTTTAQPAADDTKVVTGGEQQKIDLKEA